MQRFTPSMAALAVATALGAPAHAAFVGGYTTGAGSQLLEANNAGAGGTTLFVDQAATGGSDLRADSGDFGFAVEVAGAWGVGDAVTITGFALPIWANDPDSDGTNNTQNGDWTVTWYELTNGGSINDYDGTDNGEVALTTSTVTFSSADAGVDEYYVVLDTPVSFTATSTGIAFNVDSASGTAIRFKTGTAAATSKRRVETTGVHQGGGTAFWSISVAGTVTPVPEPASAALVGLGALCVASRRRR